MQPETLQLLKYRVGRAVLDVELHGVAARNRDSAYHQQVQYARIGGEIVDQVPGHTRRADDPDVQHRAGPWLNSWSLAGL